MKIKSIAKPIANIVTHPRVLGPAVFLGIGTIKTIKDYHEAPTNERTKTLLKDLSILSGSVVAFSIANPISKIFCNTQFFKTLTKYFQNAFEKINKKQLTTNNAIKKTGEIIDKTEQVIKNAIAGTFNTLFGVIGAVLADTFMEKQVFSKPPFAKEDSTENTDKNTQEKIQNNPAPIMEENTPSQIPSQSKELVQNYIKASNIFNKFLTPNATIAKQTANRVFSTVSDVPGLKLLSSPMMALTSFSVVNTEGYNNKIKKTCYERLANTMIPTIFATTASMLVENKKAIIKYPTILAFLLIGAQIGEKTANRLQEKMNAKIDKITSKSHLV